MIVKNDAERLRRCLNSVKDLVSDMVIVDTGSTDSTLEVAQEFGARLLEREWPDDFAQALNWALDVVEHEWTLRLDSDEWLLAGQLERIRPLLDRTDLLGVRFIRETIKPTVATPNHLCCGFGERIQSSDIEAWCMNAYRWNCLRKLRRVATFWNPISASAMMATWRERSRKSTDGT
jgi:glycosyltransferase involved in cell wall biosynthesis